MKSFKKGLIHWAQVEVDKVMTNEQSLRNMLEKWNVAHVEKEATEKIEQVITEKIQAFLEEYYTYTWEQALPHSVHEKIESAIPNVSAFILGRATQFFESEEGKTRLSKMIDDFFASRGTLLNLVGMFLGNVSVVDRVQPEVIKFLGQDGTKQLLTDVLQKRVGEVKRKRCKRSRNVCRKRNDCKLHIVCS